MDRPNFLGVVALAADAYSRLAATQARYRNSNSFHQTEIILNWLEEVMVSAINLAKQTTEKPAPRSPTNADDFNDEVPF